MAELLHEVIDPTYTRANLIVRMKSSQYVHQREVINRLQAHLDEHFSDGPLRARLAGRVNLDYHWLCLIRTSHIYSVALSFGCVLLLTGLMFRSLAAGLLCLFTVGVAVLINYAIMGFSDIPLGVGTSMFASIAIGAGVNFPIHMLDRLRVSFRDHRAATVRERTKDELEGCPTSLEVGDGGEGCPTSSEVGDGRTPDPANIFPYAYAFTGRVLFFTAFVVAVGFLLLCVSEFRTLARFGLLIGIGMLTSFATSVTLLPAIVAWSKPRLVWKS
jgi:predicted RND superfamily exporter protein